jgi:Na+-translocating ferredoxin:NAD+ oxidoreductase RnfG subunit
MLRIVFYSILLLILSGLSLTLKAENPDKRVVKDVEKIFGTSSEIRQISLGEEEVSGLQTMNSGDLVYRIQGVSDESGYILSTSAKGRYDEFDYSVLYSEDLAVLGIRVTVYRSSHGAAICSKGWLKQFIGYKGGNLELGKEVDSVSGATISASSMVNDMQRCYETMVLLKANVVGHLD